MIRSPSTNRDSYFLVSGNLAVALLGVLSQYLILVSLDTVEYGIWVLLLDAALTIGTLTDFGIPDAMIRIWDGSRDGISRVVKKGLATQTLLASTIIILVTLTYPLEYFGNLDFSVVILMVSGSVLLFQLGSMRIGLRMYGRADEESLAMLVDRILYIIALLIAVRYGPTIENFSKAFCCAALTSFLYTAWRYYSNSSRNISFYLSKDELSKKEIISMISLASPFALSLFLFPLFGRIDKFIIAFFEGTIQVGYFNIPWLVILSGLAVPRSIRQAALPDLGSNKGSKERFSSIVDKSWNVSALLIWVGVPASIMLSNLVFEEVFPMRLVSPKDFDYSGVRLLICLLPAWVWAMIGSLELEVLKLEKSPFKYTLIISLALLINFTFGILAIPRLGLLGASISSAIGFFSLFVSSYVYGPFHGTNSKLIWKKTSVGVLYSILLLSMAINWNSGVIAESAFRAAMLTALFTLPLALVTAPHVIREILYQRKNRYLEADGK